VAGRKWATADAGSYKLWYDDGARWHEIGGDAIELEVVAGEVLAKGDVVSVTGYNTGLNLATVAKYTGAAPAFGITSEAIGNGARGYIINTGYITDIKTDTFGATGTILYPAATGTFTSTKPTSGQYQVSAYVLRSNSTNGVLFVEFSGSRIVERSDNTASTIVLRDGSGNFAAGTITAALTGNSSTATALSSSRTFAVTGDVTGSVSSDLTGGASIATSIASGVIVDADINASAGIVDTKLATISTAGKVSNSATTATSANTNSAIVARDGSGDFSAGTITASLTGNASTATTLQTARTINSVSFNGSADVNVPAIAKIASAATVDLSSGASQTLLTHSLANIAAGDVIEVDLNFAWLNGTGVSRTLTLTVDVDGYNMALTSSGIFNANRFVGNGYWKVAVISSSLVVSNAQFGVSNGVVKGATSGGFSEFSQYNDGSNNLTGTRTVTVSAITSASGADQDLSSVIVQCRLIKGV
jgi:hypothetical protein